ncbi:hypothetical protein SSX86_009723 [Deinandra increscens subsp. villosa]|uniref:Uncharacterized protein n=1 Tax=Deinandra increscens subsp. villosa TaxID=3103831 RepID=A0AAP0D9Q2_9ASTR
MEVQLLPPLPPPSPPSPPADFTCDSTSTSPYATAPSSPQSIIPFTWEEKPGIPKQDNNYEQETGGYSDFAFGCLERHSISAADELFDGGKIKPLKPPPRLHSDSPRSPKSPKSPKSRFREAISPRGKKNDFDPFSEAFKQTSGEQNQAGGNCATRGRERVEKTGRHKPSRSLSPFRLSDAGNRRGNSKDRSSPAAPTWYNKWNLKNLLLFRSASEGSAAARMSKMSKKEQQLFSFRSVDGGGGAGFTAAEEVEERGRRKGGLPYKSGLMGCLRFHQNGGSVHEISRGIDCVMKR